MCSIIVAQLLTEVDSSQLLTLHRKLHWSMKTISNIASHISSYSAVKHFVTNDRHSNSAYLRFLNIND